MQSIGTAILALLLATSSFCGSAATNSPAPTNDSGYTINWTAVPLDVALKTYASTLGRTVLEQPSVPSISITLSLQNATKAEFQKAVENALREEGIASIPDGDTFQLIILASEEKKWPEIIASLPVIDDAQKGYTFAYNGVDMRQVMPVYGDLVRRKWINETLPPAGIRLSTVHPLTKAEAVHALNAIFALNGVKIVNVGDDSFKTVFLSQSDK